MRGQIWIENAVYMLVGLSLIGIVLMFVTPKITASQEKVVIEQSINSLKSLDEVISDVIDSGAGNSRTYSIQFKRGEFVVNAREDVFSFEIGDVRTPYSQEGALINRGAVKILTSKQNKNYKVELILNYSKSIDMLVESNDYAKVYTSAPAPYKFIIANDGIINAASGKLVVSIGEIS